MGHLIAKIQERNFIEDMYSNEYLYFRFQKHFREGTKGTKGGNDPRDGNLFTEQVSRMELEFPTGEKMKFVRGSNMGHADYSEHLQNPPVNICCLSIIPLSDDLRPKSVSNRLSELGDSAILIYDTERFYDAIEKSLSDLGYPYEMKPVKYYNYNEHNGRLSFFDKDIEFSYQNEYRILIWPNLAGDLKIPVPELKTMSVVIESSKILKLEIELFNAPQN